MEKKDLQLGMVVEKRNGNRGLVVGVMINHQMTSIILDEFGFEYVHAYTDDLKIPRMSFMDIVKVYDARKYFGLGYDCIIQTNDLPLLWERHEVIEVTLQEVAEKFGVDSVKIVEQ